LLPNAVSSSIALLIIVDLVHASAAGSNEEDVVVVVVVVVTFAQSIMVVLFVILVLTVSESVFVFFEGFVFVQSNFYEQVLSPPSLSMVGQLLANNYYYNAQQHTYRKTERPSPSFFASEVAEDD
jgi:hypothetical protein